VFSNFYILFHGILSVFSQHSTYLYLSILSVRFVNIFTRLLSNFYPLKSHFCLVVLQRFTAIFFIHFYRLRSFVVSDEISAERLLWSTSWFRRDIFFYYLSFSYYFFYLIHFLLFILLFYFLFFIFSFFIYFITYFICVLFFSPI